ncbi:N-acetylmuramoyl-L-alanine amidase [Pseudoclavibacter helvolus]
MPLATIDHTFRTNQKSSRHGSKVRALQLHHATSTSWRSVVDMMVSGSREVSSNDVVGANGELIEVVERGARAWTSGSATFDAQAHTMEICNAALGDASGWPVSDAAHETVANRCADIAFENGFIIERSTTNFSLYGHGEMYLKWESPTKRQACPAG